MSETSKEKRGFWWRVVEDGAVPAMTLSECRGLLTDADLGAELETERCKYQSSGCLRCGKISPPLALICGNCSGLAQQGFKKAERIKELEKKWWACMHALYKAHEAGADIPDIHDLLEPECYEHDYRYGR